MSRPSTATPLLSGQTESPQSETPVTAPASSLDELIEHCIGDFGWAQFLQASLISLSRAFDAQQTFVSVFTNADPTWHCTSSLCNSAADLCQLPRNSWTWDMPMDTSIVSDWSLECASSIVRGLPASSFFFGSLAGGFILPTLADSTSLGRKNMLLLSCLLMSLASLFAAASTNIWMYSVLRIVCGFGRASVGTCALVLSTELVGKRRRGQVGVLTFLFYSFGYLSLPFIAYLNKGSSWRSIYLWTSIPAIIYCLLLHFLVRESPRWLFLQGRKEEFVATLNSIGNRKSLTAGNLSEIDAIEQESSDTDIYSAIKILFKKGWAIGRLFTVMVVGFGICIVYYGMSLGNGSLGSDLYLNVTLNALSELSAALATFFLIRRLSRKGSILGFSIVSGVCSCTLMITSISNISGSSNNNKDHIHYTESGWISTSWLQIGTKILSFFSSSMAIHVLHIYALELFPTCVRNSAMAMAREAFILAGVISPMLVAAGRENEVLLYGVFALAIVFCGSFVTFLPETKGSSICDTMDEEEHRVMATKTSKNLVC